MRRGIFVASCLLVLLFAFAGSAQAARYDTNTVIVKYASGVSTAERLALFDSAGVTRTVGSVSGVGAKVVRVSADPAVVAERLNRSALVDYAEPNFVLKSTATTIDPILGELYGFNNTGQTGGRADADIDAPEGWDAAGLGSFPATGGVKIGIVDTGIDQTHPELSGKVVNCITWTHSKGAKVISMSLGGGASTTLQNAVAAAWENGGPNGSVLVAAAGNDGNSNVNYPAGYAQVISVAATDHNDAKASFSNANADVEVAAPGVDVLSTVRGG